MEHKNPFKKSTLLFMLFTILISFVMAEGVFAYGFYYWEKGASGLELALMDAEEGEKPLVLFFYSEYGEWNKRMVDEYIADYEVEDFLEDIPKAVINTDEGEDEKAAAAKYGVEQYPAFFVFIPSFNTKPQRIHPFSEKAITTQEFIKKVKENIVYEYNKNAVTCFEQKDYENALKYLEMSLSFDTETAYTYYAMGTVYNALAAEQNDQGLLKTAEENYSEALELDPDHQLSLEALQNLEKEMEKQ